MDLDFLIDVHVHAEVVVGLGETVYQVSEDVGVVEVCAVVYKPDSTVLCPISLPFNISLSTSDARAGVYHCYSTQTHLPQHS